MSLIPSAMERPFAAAEEDVQDLQILADIVVANKPRETKQCAFKLDGKPCRLCHEGEDENDGEDGDESKQVKKEGGCEGTHGSEPSPHKNGEGCCGSGNTSCKKEENTADPYERKKQKAKQSRVQLNTALEELAQAMGHASDDAHQRIQKFADTTAIPLAPLPKKYDPSEKHKKCHSKSITDRPNFILAATSVLVGVSQHCQALEEEVRRLRHQLQLQPQLESNGGSCGKRKNDKPGCCQQSRKKPCCH